MAEFTTLGAIVGLVIAIVLIIKKVQPAYSLILGALIGGIMGSQCLWCFCFLCVKYSNIKFLFYMHFNVAKCRNMCIIEYAC